MRRRRSTTLFVGLALLACGIPAAPGLRIEHRQRPVLLLA
jgi:thiamine pyrophosphate-dependent acetolactate synthase large subunit-like protein